MSENYNLQKLEEQLESLEKRIKKIEDLISADKGSIAPNKKVSLKEFLTTKNVDSDVKKALAIAYFVEYIEYISPFNTDDLKKFFRLAKMPLPQNLNDKINSNIKKGYIMEVEESKDSKKAWELTNTGEKFVESGLN